MSNRGATGGQVVCLGTSRCFDLLSVPPSSFAAAMRQLGHDTAVRAYLTLLRTSRTGIPLNDWTTESHPSQAGSTASLVIME